MTNWIQTNEGRIAYEMYGESGQPIVAIPGIGDTRASYRALAPILAAAGYRVFVIDLRGHGESDVRFSSYRPEDIGDDVVALLDTLDLQDAVLLGNSVGAAASIHASLVSQRIQRLVSLSGFVADPPNFRFMRILLTVMFAWPWGVWFWGKYRRTLFQTTPPDLDINQGEVLANLREPGRLRAMRSMMCASKIDITARLNDVSVPALIAMGANDPDFADPVAEASQQCKNLGGTNRVAIIENAGHYPQIECVDETARVILEFMKEEINHGS